MHMIDTIMEITASVFFLGVLVLREDFSRDRSVGALVFNSLCKVLYKWLKFFTTSLDFSLVMEGYVSEQIAATSL